MCFGNNGGVIAVKFCVVCGRITVILTLYKTNFWLIAFLPVFISEIVGIIPRFKAVYGVFLNVNFV